jgi:hypothetical protein
MIDPEVRVQIRRYFYAEPSTGKWARLLKRSVFIPIR